MEKLTARLFWTGPCLPFFFPLCLSSKLYVSTPFRRQPDGLFHDDVSFPSTIRDRQQFSESHPKLFHGIWKKAFPFLSSLAQRFFPSLFYGTIGKATYL